MIYHLNEIDEGKLEVLPQYLVDASGNYVQGYDKNVVIDIPLTKPIYEYRTEEALAKLYAVKEWLEYNIIGVGAYISEITGDGIYFAWQKTQGYIT